MFDANTRALIEEAPALRGLDRKALPEELTRAFAAISAARLRLVSATAERRSEEREALQKDVAFLRGLANTYEAMALLMPSGTEGLRSTAFVAATAYRYLFLTQHVWDDSARPAPDVSGSSISSRVSAALLFMAAGYFPDAAELARLGRFRTRGGGRLVSLPLRELLLGNCARSVRIGSRSSPLVGEIVDDRKTIQYRLELSLFAELREAVTAMAAMQLEPDSPSVRVEASLDNVVEDSVIPIPPPEGTAVAGVAALAGAHQLALLLRLAWKTVREQRVVTVPPPAGVSDSKGWTGTLRRVAESRPLLWENHIDALRDGFLDVGMSSAVAFPTGAGKSTLVQLKIASTINSGRQALVIAPTNALVYQFVRELSELFGRKMVSRGVPSVEKNGDAPKIIVTTPEACLAALDETPASLADVGVCVFDECHLLAGEVSIQDRRSLDAMAMLLRLLESSPDTDVVLISAMMANARELSRWLAAITGRRSLPLDDQWKPTRQLKGCVVYPASDLILANRQIDAASNDRRTKGPPAALRKSVKGTPHVIFSHRYSWTTTDSEDYSIQKVTDESVPFSIGQFTPPGTTRSRWYATSNRNEVAGALAAKLVRTEVSTMVLAQHVRDLGPIAERVAGEAVEIPPCEYTDDESALLESAVAELGSSSNVFSPVDGRVAFHHGLLLQEERQLSESLFRRGALKAIVVTPTLAQGMNLPAEAIVIAGDDRFDAELDRRRVLDPEDLLNAAGRAGRASTNATGIVLIVPGRPTAFDAKADSIGERWFELRERVFSGTDQCVPISDPFEIVLDAITADGPGGSDVELDLIIARHFGDLDEAEIRKRLNMSLAAFAAKRKYQVKAFQKKVDALISRRAKHASIDPAMSGALDVAGSLGRWCAKYPERLAAAGAWSPLDWCSAAFDWLAVSPEHARLAGANWVAERQEKDGEPALVVCRDAVFKWMAGRPLSEIEETLLQKRRSSKCLTARALVLRELPLLAMVVRELGGQLSVLVSNAAVLGGNAARCIRGGFDTIGKLGLTQVRTKLSRVAIHSLADEIGLPKTGGCDLARARREVRRALDDV